MVQTVAMEKIRQQILISLDTITDDGTLIRELHALAEKEGDVVYQAIVHVLTSLEMPADEARRDWQRIVAHRQVMTLAMQRDVSIRTAICDYFCTVDKSLRNPKVVEIHIFEKTLKDCTYDRLTGLINRHSFDFALERELSLAARYDTDVSLLFFDIDDFKLVNDHYGHQAGDEALKMLADIIRQEKRTSDIAGRYGGEEIVVLLPYTNNFDALVLGERIRVKVAEAVLIHDDDHIQFTISGGLASYPIDAKDPTSLIKYADTAMYRAKGRGKNAIAFFSQDKRRYLRITHSQPISVRELGFHDDPMISEAESRNISMGGLLIESNCPFAIGSKLQINIPLNEECLLVIGKVVRVEAFGDNQFEIGLAISFQEMDKLAKKEISTYLSLKGKPATPPTDNA